MKYFAQSNFPMLVLIFINACIVFVGALVLLINGRTEFLNWFSLVCGLGGIAFFINEIS